MVADSRKMAASPFSITKGKWFLVENLEKRINSEVLEIMAGEILALQKTANKTWSLWKADKASYGVSERYFSDTEYHYASSLLAGFESQIRAKGTIGHGFEFFDFLSRFSFITPDIFSKYFDTTQQYELFLAHLVVEQKLLELILEFNKVSQPEDV